MVHGYSTAGMRRCCYMRKPEPLGGILSGWWLRRVNRKRRLVYRVTGEGNAQALETTYRRHYRQRRQAPRLKPLVSTESGMINRIKLKFGPTPASEPLEFDVSPITVFVGPNYSGKSKLIREIADLVRQGRPLADNVILDDADFRPYSTDEASDAVDEVTLTPNLGEVLQPDHIIVGRYAARTQVPRPQLIDALTQFSTSPQNSHLRQWAGQWFLNFGVRLLDGQSRIGLSNDQSFGDLSLAPQSSFQAVFRDDALRQEIRDIIFKAFGQYLVFDPTHAGKIRLRLSSSPPESLEQEQGLTQKAATFHSQATLLGQASDGAKAFCGILIEIMAGQPDMLLLDEPEAFLHPALSYQLGAEVARQLQGTSKRLFVSTHSSNFLMGCVSSGTPVNVVRLTYRDGVATARHLSNDQLSAIMRNPLLRSAGVLSGLFFENVVMTEADTDRSFYQEVNERLIRAEDPRGIPNCLFINANGKDAIPVIIEPLRKLGIPVAAIYDLDFLKDGGAVATRRLTATGVPPSMQPSVNTARSSVKSALEAASVNFKKEGGLSVLTGGDLTAARSYLSQLSSFGTFLVPIGEVEHWLAHLGITGHASNWLIPMFERMGEDGAASDYVYPANGDVWDFMGEVKNWLRNPSRLGIPV